MSNLSSVLQRYTDKVEPKYPEIPGIIGIVLNGSKTVEVPSRGQFLYVRLRANTSEFVTAYNDKVFPGYDLPVIVQWKHGRYEIVRRDSERYTDWETENPYLPKHGAVHSMNVDGGKLGSDPVWVYPYNFMPALVSPFFDNNALNVYINPQYINFRGTWRYIGNTGTPSLSTYNPVSGSCIILVTIDGDSGNPALFISSGTYIPSSVTGSVELTQYVPTFDAYRYLPLSFVVIQSGTTRINWGNLHDVRQFVGNMVGSTGTASAGGSGISGISIQDEGIPKGTGTVLNFVGVNVDVSVSGTVARVFVTGSTGGGSIPTFTTGSVPYAGGNGVLKESNEWLNFDEDSPTLWAGRKLTYSGIQYSDFRFFARATGTNSVVAIGGIAIGTGSLGSPSMTLNGYKARGTFAAPTPVQDGDALLTLIGNGYDGVTWQNAARIRLYADGNWITGSHVITRMDFDVTPSGSATRRTQFQVYGNSVNIPTGSTYNVGGTPHAHLDLDPYNFIINGGGNFFQRVDPTAFTTMTDGGYDASDRFYSLIQGTGATEKQGSAIGTSKASIRLTAGGTTNRYGKAQIIESVNSIALRNKTFTAQLRIKPTNNAGSGSRNYRIALLSWSGTADAPTKDIVNDWTSSNYTVGNFFTSTTLTLIGTATISVSHGTEGVLSVTGVVPSNCNNLYVMFWTQDVPTHASDYAEFGEVGGYVSPVVQDWKQRLRAQEENLCLRHCVPLTDANQGVAGYLYAFTGCRVITTLVDIFVKYPVEMFATPTLLTNSIAFSSAASPTGNKWGCYDNVAGGWITAVGAVTLTITNNSAVGGTLRTTAGTSLSGAAGSFCNLYWGLPRVVLSAEIGV